MRFLCLGNREKETLLFLSCDKENPMSIGKIAYGIEDSYYNTYQRVNYRLIPKGLIRRVDRESKIKYYALTKLGYDTIVRIIKTGNIKEGNYIGKLQVRILRNLGYYAKLTISQLMKLIDGKQDKNRHKAYYYALESLMKKGYVWKRKGSKYNTNIYGVSREGLFIAKNFVGDRF